MGCFNIYKKSNRNPIGTKQKQVSNFFLHIGYVDIYPSMPPYFCRMGRNEDDSRSIRSRRRGQAELKSKVIQFSCIFCNDFFPTTNGLFDHMRSSHKNLCDIPQITADSDLLEEIAGEKEVDR